MKGKCLVNGVAPERLGLDPGGLELHLSLGRRKGVEGSLLVGEERLVVDGIGGRVRRRRDGHGSDQTSSDGSLEDVGRRRSGVVVVLLLSNVGRRVRRSLGRRGKRGRVAAV